MSKTSQANKKAKAEGKALKGKKALTAASKKAKKEAPKTDELQKPSIPNYGKCCTCKTYAKFPDGCGHMCRTTGKPTPRKATCDKYAYRD